MRTLCLHLNKNSLPTVAENFLSFSPRVQFRDPGLVFADVSSTSHLFGGEAHLLEEAIKSTEEFFPNISAAIADSPFAAQVLSAQKGFYISNPTEDIQHIGSLPLQALRELEGLSPWTTPQEIDEIISFFHVMGFHHIGEIREFEVEALRERWGKTGELLWKRLHGLDQQVISPLLPTESLVEYIHLDFPISLSSLLLHSVEKSLKKLFSRLQGRAEFAHKINLHLYCEYSDKYHLIEVQPAKACRDLELYLQLLENRISDLDLENPIREVEVEILPCPEKIQQLGFWQPKVSDKDKLQKVMSVFHQATLTTGFINPRNALMPEDGWTLETEFKAYVPIVDEYLLDGDCFHIKPSYSSQLHESPRPSRILEEPKELSEREIHQMQFLTEYPLERFETQWWDESRGRDYYFATSKKGQHLWIYFDHMEKRYFLHGYFD